jgi:hypothetical protein
MAKIAVQPWKKMEEKNEADMVAGFLPVKRPQNTQDGRPRLS